MQAEIFRENYTAIAIYFEIHKKISPWIKE